MCCSLIATLIGWGPAGPASAERGIEAAYTHHVYANCFDECRALLQEDDALTVYTGGEFPLRGDFAGITLLDSSLVIRSANAYEYKGAFPISGVDSITYWRHGRSSLGWVIVGTFGGMVVGSLVGAVIMATTHPEGCEIICISLPALAAVLGGTALGIVAGIQIPRSHPVEGTIRCDRED